MSEYGFETTTDEVLDGIDLTGRRFVVTGASSGLGEETARALAARGARVGRRSRPRLSYALCLDDSHRPRKLGNHVGNRDNEGTNWP